MKLVPKIPTINMVNLGYRELHQVCENKYNTIFRMYKSMVAYVPSQWIDVNYDLPRSGEVYLCMTTELPFPITLFYEEDPGYWQTINGSEMWEVTHWMPNIDPPFKNE